jgi:hypothetical protein
VEGQAEGGLGEPLQVVFAAVHGDAGPALVGLDHPVEDAPELGGVGNGEVDDGDVLLDVGREGEGRGQQDEAGRMLAALERGGGVAQEPEENRVGGPVIAAQIVV